MPTLFHNLQCVTLHISIRPRILSCFGRIAQASSAQFEKHLAEALEILEGDSQTCAQMEILDEEMRVYANQLRIIIFQCYSGILIGLTDEKAELMIPYAHSLVRFIELVYEDSLRDKNVTVAATALLGDLASVVGRSTKHLFTLSFCNKLLLECFDSGDDELVDCARVTQYSIDGLHIYLRYHPVFCVECFCRELWKDAARMAAWDLENMRITRFKVHIAVLRIHLFLTLHGYSDKHFPDVKLVHASRGDLSQDLVQELQNCKSVTYLRDLGRKKQRADTVTKTVIGKWCEIHPGGVVLLISSDRGFSDFLHMLLGRGFKCMVVYDPNRMSIEYLRSLELFQIPHVTFQTLYAIQENPR